MAANAALAANRDRQWIEEQVKKGPMRTLMKSPRRTPKVYHPWEVESVPGAGVAGDNYLGRAVRIVVVRQRRLRDVVATGIVRGARRDTGGVLGERLG